MYCLFMETCKVFKTSAAKEGSRAAVVIQRLVRGVQARQRTLLVRSNAAGRERSIIDPKLTDQNWDLRVVVMFYFVAGSQNALG